MKTIQKTRNRIDECSRVLLAALAVVLLLTSAWAIQNSEQLEVEFKAVMHKELVDGDLEGAIADYKSLVARTGSDRELAAKALLQMGKCYEKLGNSEAQKAYQQVVRDYFDQTEQAEQARAQLAVLKSMIAHTLIEAAADGDIEQVKLLISQGAEVDAKDFEGRTALHFAAENGLTEVAEILIKNGADVNAKYLSRTPLHGAAGGGQFGGFEGPIEIVELLIEKGADINVKNALGVTPLHMATRNGRKDIVELLIAKGADINATNNRGITPLDMAKGIGHTEIIKLLREHGAVE